MPLIAINRLTALVFIIYNLEWLLFSQFKLPLYFAPFWGVLVIKIFEKPLIYDDNSIKLFKYGPKVRKNWYKNSFNTHTRVHMETRKWKTTYPSLDKNAAQDAPQALPLHTHTHTQRQFLICYLIHALNWRQIIVSVSSKESNKALCMLSPLFP